jgi:hypothetical protein
MLLLVAVPSLSTLAKTSWYLPQSDAGHYLTGQVKMQLTQHPAAVERIPLQVLIETIPTKPPIRIRPQTDWEPSVKSIAVRVSLQHRSPPNLVQ